MTTWTPSPDLTALLDRAERENKLLLWAYSDVKFTAAGLREAWKEGRFRHGAANWRLIDAPPSLEETIEKACNETSLSVALAVVAIWARDNRKHFEPCFAALLKRWYELENDE